MFPHTCDKLMMAMREICCSDEGDQGLNEGESLKLQKGFSLSNVDYSIHTDTLSME